jgi:hypothetical protein
MATTMNTELRDTRLLTHDGEFEVYLKQFAEVGLMTAAVQLAVLGQTDLPAQRAAVSTRPSTTAGGETPRMG